MQFYYGWKKTRDATRPKPLTRQRNTTAATHRKPKNNQPKVCLFFPPMDLQICFTSSSSRTGREGGHGRTKLRVRI